MKDTSGPVEKATETALCVTPDAPCKWRLAWGGGWVGAGPIMVRTTRQKTQTVLRLLGIFRHQVRGCLLPFWASVTSPEKWEQTHFCAGGRAGPVSAYLRSGSNPVSCAPMYQVPSVPYQ
jgi:hypothetical protein